MTTTPGPAGAVEDPGGSVRLLGAALVLVAFLVAAGLAAVATLAAVIGGAAAQPPPACEGQSTGGIGPAAGGRLASPKLSDLSPTQLGHAQTWVDVGEQMGIPGQGIVVALATVSQESRFKVYANDGRGADLAPEQRDVARSLDLPHDAVGSDHGSVGLAQQQYPWWGTLEELMDPATSARLFYEALLEVPAWQSLSVTDAAQAVQRSAFPGAYADDEPLARQLLAQLAGTGAPDAVQAGLCGSGTAMACPPTGLAVEEGLTPDALRVLRCVHQEFGSHSYGGVGDRPDNPRSDHPSGRAVDVMIDDWAGQGNTHGWQVADWVVAHAAGLGVKDVIWDKQIWSAAAPEQGWRPYAHPSGRSSPTLDHLDHVHVSVYGNAAGGTGAGEWTLPLPPGTYQLTSGYGPRVSPGGIGSTNHAGLDFGAPSGTAVRAATAGQITSAGPSGGYGYLVVIASGNVTTYYAHLLAGSITVAVGEQVAAGQVIGAVGSTGASTGPHLHFEIRVDGVSTDPLPYLRQHGVDPGSLR